jgi:hypothetical protein
VSPRLLYLLTVGENRRRRETSRAHREGYFGRDPLSYSDGDDLTAANWAGYGPHAVGEMRIRSGR